MPIKITPSKNVYIELHIAHMTKLTRLKVQFNVNKTLQYEM